MRKCQVCGKPTDYIELPLCHKCFVKSLDNMTLRNMVVGGEFHGEKWEKHIKELNDTSREEKQ